MMWRSGGTTRQADLYTTTCLASGSGYGDYDEPFHQRLASTCGFPMSVRPRVYERTRVRYGDHTDTPVSPTRILSHKGDAPAGPRTSRGIAFSFAGACTGAGAERRNKPCNKEEE